MVGGPGPKNGIHGRKMTIGGLRLGCQSSCAICDFCRILCAFLPTLVKVADLALTIGSVVCLLLMAVRSRQA
jgi:hypothetical protein